MFSLLLTFVSLLSSAQAGYTSAGSFARDIDGSSWEVLGESVNAHSACGGGNLGQTTNEVNAFISQMYSAGYTNYRHYSDTTAWASDLEQARSDAYYNELADFTYVSTHGSSGAAYFCGSSGDNVVTASETRWGDEDIDFVAFSSCNTLDSAGRTAFGTANLNAGIHYIMGFESVALDVSTTGDKYGYYLRNGYYIDTAWLVAVDDAHGAGFKSADVRFTSAACNTWYDKAATVSCDPKSGSSYVTASWSTY